MYGGPVPKFDAIDWPTTNLSNDDVDYYGFNSYFYVYFYIPLLIGVELMDQGIIKKTFKELLDDVVDCINA